MKINSSQAPYFDLYPKIYFTPCTNRFQKDLYVSGNIYQTGSFYTQGDIVLSGSINIGNSLTGDTINFGGEVNSHIIPTTNNTYDLGSLDFQWKDIYVSTGSIGELTLENQLTLINSGSNVQSYIGVASGIVSGSATLIDLGSFDGANFDYIVKNGSNMKCGNIASIWNGSISSHNELNTTDLGDTSPVSFDVTNHGL